MKQLMIAAPSSGSGKTTLACGLLAALRERGIRTAALKCGPDYIDPMFHSQVLGAPSRNLDPFLQGEEGIRRTLSRTHPDSFALLESAMGFYDGLNGTDQCSGWAVARQLQTPVVLVIHPEGVGLTLAAQIRGLLDFRTPSRIAGLLLNRCKPSLGDYLAPLLERETGLPVLGCLPPMEQAEIGSRHLGLLTPGEVADFSGRCGALAARLEECADLSRLMGLAEDLPSPPPPAAGEKRCTIAVAWDEAFCFYYQDSLDALREAGAELAFFSPLRDRSLPSGIGGLYLGGGYPELHARALSGNRSLREEIRQAVQAGLPTLAECGGFLYLQRTLKDPEGNPWPMAGVLSGEGFPTGRLQRFGYQHLTARQDSLLFRQGERIPAHEFHYWDCTENGGDLTACKGGREWACGVVSPTLYAGFPHLHLDGRIPLAERFVSAAERGAAR